MPGEIEESDFVRDPSQVIAKRFGLGRRSVEP
jgi:hypothetical protein